MLPITHVIPEARQQHADQHGEHWTSAWRQDSAPLWPITVINAVRLNDFRDKQLEERKTSCVCQYVTAV